MHEYLWKLASTQYQNFIQSGYYWGTLTLEQVSQLLSDQPEGTGILANVGDISYPLLFSVFHNNEHNNIVRTDVGVAYSYFRGFYDSFDNSFLLTTYGNISVFVAHYRHKLIPVNQHYEPIYTGPYDVVAQNFYMLNNYLQDDSLFVQQNFNALLVDLNCAQNSALIRLSNYRYPSILCTLLTNSGETYNISYENNSFELRITYNPNAQYQTLTDTNIVSLINTFLELEGLDISRHNALWRLAATEYQAFKSSGWYWGSLTMNDAARIMRHSPMYSAIIAHLPETQYPVLFTILYVNEDNLIARIHWSLKYNCFVNDDTKFGFNPHINIASLMTEVGNALTFMPTGFHNAAYTGTYDVIAKNFLQLQDYLNDNSLMSRVNRNDLLREIRSLPDAVVVNVTGLLNNNQLAELITGRGEIYDLKYIDGEFHIGLIHAHAVVDVIDTFIKQNHLQLYPHNSLQRLAFRMLRDTDIPTKVKHKLGFQ